MLPVAPDPSDNLLVNETPLYVPAVYPVPW